MAFRGSQKGVAETECELRKVDTNSAIDIASHLLAMAMLLALPCSAGGEELRPYTVTGDSISGSLTGAPGDAARGRALVLERTNTCILCHSGPFPEEKFQGDLAPNLSGSGSRWSVGQLRLRLVDASRLNPATIMPSYYRLEGLDRVAPNWRGKPILSAEQIEDIVAYLATLRD
jgi:sulfur-oxidizing protein SoxX